MSNLDSREKQQIDRIKMLSSYLDQLYGNNILTVDEVFLLVKKVGREPCQEINYHREIFFTKTDYVQKMIFIGNKYQNNPQILGEILNGLGVLAYRYNKVNTVDGEKLSQNEIQAIFDFILKYVDRKEKNIQKFLALRFPYHPLFLKYDHKWEFLLSITKLTPKSDYMRAFRKLTEYYIKSIPKEVKTQYILVLQNYLPKSPPASSNDYIRTIQKLQDSIKDMVTP